MGSHPSRANFPGTPAEQIRAAISDGLRSNSTSRAPGLHVRELIETIAQYLIRIPLQTAPIRLLGSTGMHRFEECRLWRSADGDGVGPLSLLLPDQNDFYCMKLNFPGDLVRVQLTPSDPASDVGALASPNGIDINPISNEVLITEAHRVRSIRMSADGKSGVIRPIAGTTKAGREGGVGHRAKFYSPRGIACSPNGTYAVVCDSVSGLRRVELDTCSVSTIASDVPSPHSICFACDRDSSRSDLMVYFTMVDPAGMANTDYLGSINMLTRETEFISFKPPPKMGPAGPYDARDLNPVAVCWLAPNRLLVSTLAGYLFVVDLRTKRAVPLEPNDPPPAKYAAPALSFALNRCAPPTTSHRRDGGGSGAPVGRDDLYFVTHGNVELLLVSGPLMASLAD